MPNQTAPSQNTPRVVPLQGGSNFRDLGGYRTADGRAVRSGAVKIAVNAVRPLAEAEAVHRDLAGRETTGSTVMVP